MKLKLFFILFLIPLIYCAQKRAVTLLADDIAVGDNYTTRQIHFSLGKWDFIPESFPTIDSIVTFLKRQKNVVAGIEVHTDKRPMDDLKSSKLSQKRAESIVGYLIDHGIAKDRLVAKGMGSSMLLIPMDTINKTINKDDQEKLHALNRRVVLRIISTEYH